MNQLKLVAMALAFWLALGLPGAAVARTAGQHVDDTSIATSTKSALASADLAAAGAINIEIYKGAVQLAGFVGSEAEESTALSAARSVKGVTEVLDALVVLVGKRTAGQTLDDTTIQSRLKAALAGSEGLGEAVAINTEVRKGQVILSGFTTDPAVRERAGALATGTPGVTQVHNSIEVRP